MILIIFLKTFLFNILKIFKNIIANYLNIYLKILKICTTKNFNNKDNKLLYLDNY